MKNVYHRPLSTLRLTKGQRRRRRIYLSKRTSYFEKLKYSQDPQDPKVMIKQQVQAQKNFNYFMDNFDKLNHNLIEKVSTAFSENIIPTPVKYENVSTQPFFEKKKKRNSPESNEVVLLSDLSSTISNSKENLDNLKIKLKNFLYANQSDADLKEYVNKYSSEEINLQQRRIAFEELSRAKISNEQKLKYQLVASREMALKETQFNKTAFPDGDAIARILQTYIKLNQSKTALETYEKLKGTLQFQDSLKSYQQLLRICGNLNETEKALQIFESNDCITQLTDSTLSDGDVNKRMVYNEILRTLGKNIFYADECNDVVDTMNLRGMTMNKYSLSLQLFCYARICDVPSAKQAMEFSRDGEFRKDYDPVVYNSFLNVLYRSQWNTNRSKKSLFKRKYGFNLNRHIAGLLYNNEKESEGVKFYDQARQIADLLPTYDTGNLYTKNKVSLKRYRDLVLDDVNVELEPEKEFFEPEEITPNLLIEKLDKERYNLGRSKMTIFAMQNKKQLQKENVLLAEKVVDFMEERFGSLQNDTLNILFKIYTETSVSTVRKELDLNAKIKSLISDLERVEMDERGYNHVILYYKSKYNWPRVKQTFENAVEKLGLENISPQTVGLVLDSALRIHLEEDTERKLKFLTETLEKYPSKSALHEKHTSFLRLKCSKLIKKYTENVQKLDPNILVLAKVAQRLIPAEKDNAPKQPVWQRIQNENAREEMHHLNTSQKQWNFKTQSAV
eukprot:snap_masked-scaffold_10-processed-gene-9.10-mRNA-1 protein AED:1.00 eAED:1.00 QI:0/0/0/0/1/1/2/0/731